MNTFRTLFTNHIIMHVIAALVLAYIIFLVCLTVALITSEVPGDWNLLPHSVYIEAWKTGPVRFIIILGLCIVSTIHMQSK